MPTIASVLLDKGLKKPLDYLVPPDWELAIGYRVQVPLQNRLAYATIVSLREEATTRPLKTLEKRCFTLPTPLLALTKWMSDYYCSPLQQVMQHVLPSHVRKETKPQEQYVVMRNKTREASIEAVIALRNKAPSQAEMLEAMLPVEKQIFLSELLEKTGGARATVDALVKKGFLQMSKKPIDKPLFADVEYFLSKPKKLHAEQAAALEKITASLEACRFEAHLLFGITGSGKTEVYLQAIAATIAQGKRAIVLVPEIALTTQTIERFKSRFTEPMAILHHRLSDQERLREWERALKGEAKIVIGARSAIFTPLPHLGLIIVDEEHESSYKQSDAMPCYHAREVALMRGKLENAVVVLGSATPSLESAYNASCGKYTLSLLQQRPEGALLPKIRVIDMRQVWERKGFTLFSEALLDAIAARVERGEQTLLFLNRRGYHTCLLCPTCGKSIECSHCDVALTFHKKQEQLSCHLCGQSQKPPKYCPHCPQTEPLKFRGIGTEQVEAALHALFPSLRTLRMDADTTRHKGSHDQLFRAFRTGKADVLIGTQMVAKGLHFPEVTLVGILQADAALQIPDFRASELTFQLITQVSGRAGRSLLPGEVLIQTALPDQMVIETSSTNNWERFFQEELAARRLFHYPPFAHLVKVRLSSKNLTLLESYAEKLYHWLIERLPKTVELSPFQPPAHAKIKEEHRLQCLLKSEKISPICHLFATFHSYPFLPKNVKILIDVHPNSTFF